MADDYLSTTRTVQYEKATEFQLIEIHEGFESMSSFKGGVTGKKVEITDRFADVDAEDKEVRFGKINLQHNSVERRWMHKPKMSSVHVGLDPDDDDETEVPLDSPLAKSVARAIKRKRQDKFLVGFYEPAAVGEEGTTTVNFLNDNILPADHGEAPATYVGLTLAKLRWIRKRARQLMIDPQEERLHMGITAEEIDDLLQINEYISKDYNPDSQIKNRGKPMSAGAEQALQDGEPTDFMGIHFVPMEFTNSKAYKNANDQGLTTNGSGHRRCPVWLPSGMSGREWRTVRMKYSIREDLDGHPEQYSAYTTCRYNRNYEEKCFIVECAD